MNFNKRARICIVLFCIILSLVGCNNKTKESENTKNEETTKVYATSFENYMEQPEINYSTFLEPKKIKAIYVSGWIAGSSKYMDKLIEIANTTEINAMVIDVKNDEGLLTFKADVPLAKEIGATDNVGIRDINELMYKLKENNIFPIARIVVFKDPLLPEKRPDLAIKNKDGSIFRAKKTAWVNPYNKESWEYIIDIAKEAARVGFKEIQFDYIRFDTSAGMSSVDLGPLAEEKSKTEIIAEFTEYAAKELKPLGVFVSADVFGTIITSKIDADLIGQDYVEMARHLDYICPMIYPSHYADGSFGIKYPDLQPYETILAALKASNEKLSQLPEEERPIVRPWLQDFTANWIDHYQVYGEKQVREQIQATYDAGLEEWLLWSPSNIYSVGALEPENN
ncbi:putative glycoside hydrolase [Defluviitalea phaphyphila]|uniref:putative glycoside hydrolase n=1 Tax=Defluviitalea phaphyphila TaxID=1473580 RepID=UPI0007310A54|nr:putative glycoside hydrolase [Defluviitalea phaphyphila]